MYWIRQRTGGQCNWSRLGVTCSLAPIEDQACGGVLPVEVVRAWTVCGNSVGRTLGQLSRTVNVRHLETVEDGYYSVVHHALISTRHVARNFNGEELEFYPGTFLGEGHSPDPDHLPFPAISSGGLDNTLGKL